MFEFKRNKEDDKYLSAVHINHLKRQRVLYISYLIESLDRAIDIEEKRRILGTTFDMMDLMIEQKFQDLEIKRGIKEQRRGLV